MLDLLVVGAGTAGCLAAKSASQKGLSVLLVDRQEEREVGRKVCGNAVGKHHFDRLSVRYPSGNELRGLIEGFYIISPDKKTRFRCPIDGAGGFMLNRREFGQRLLRESIDAGADFRDRLLAVRPMVRDDFVVGAVFRDLASDSEERIEATVTIDATGFAAALRRRLPKAVLPETEVDGKDVQACYREIRSVDQALEPYCRMYVSQRASPGGYSWIFPGQDETVNVGIGIQMVHGFPNPKRQLYRYVLSDPLFNGSRIIEGGTWFVPTRSPLDCMTANGFLVVGDAACLTNPITGGGIGPSMLSGKLAAEAAVDAIEVGDASKGKLWNFNRRFMREYGAKQVALDIFRIFLQRLGDEELVYGMSHELIKEEDLLKISSDGRLRLGVGEKALRILRGLKRFALLGKLSKVAKVMREVEALYLNYPSPDHLIAWKAEVSKLRNGLERAL